MGQALGINNLEKVPDLKEHGFFCDKSNEMKDEMKELWRKEIES